MQTFHYKFFLPCKKEEVFHYFKFPQAFKRLLPQHEKIIIDKMDPISKKNAEVIFHKKLLFFPIRWHAKITSYNENDHFIDEMIKGPLPYWKHSHRFIKSNKGCYIEDEIAFKLPFYLKPFTKTIKKKLEQLFTYRRQVISNDLKHLTRFEKKRLSILISGASGLVGQQLKQFLSFRGYDIYTLTRKNTTSAHNIHWDPGKKEIDISKLHHFDVVIHLAGESIAGLWTSKKKTRIYHSRIDSTQFLASVLEKNNIQPKLMICASADGFYGSNPKGRLTEESPCGSDFLAKVCVDWEKAAASIPADRIVNTRFSMILAPHGGALLLIKKIFKLGIGAILGDGKQTMPWIFIDDVVYQIDHIIHTKSLDGPVNFSSPNLVTNQEFSKDLAIAINRWTIGKIPKWVLKLLYGELATSLLLSDKRIQPKKLIDSDALFAYPYLKQSLLHMFCKEIIDEHQ